MTCHECGSDVAEIDVFCPFCGISLEPVSLADDQLDDSMASTIMIQPAEIDALAKEPETPIDASANESDLSAATASSPTPPIENPEEVKSSKADSDEVSIDDIPAPMILGDATKTVDNLVANSTSEYSLIDDEADKVSEIEHEPASLEESASYAPEIPASAVSFEVPVTEFQATPEVEAVPLVAGSDASLSEPENIAAEPSTAVFTSSEDSGGDKNISDKAAADADSKRDPGLYEARLPSNFEGIAKPSEEFESGDSYPANSTFDSVRIMENRPTSQPDDVDTRIHPPAHLGEPEPIAEKNAPAATGEKESSSTAHSIGIGETDGKRSAKLKPLSEGTVLNGRYEIVRKIGGGGMGAVYLASDNNLGGVLRAVKEMVQAHIEEEQQEKAINDFKRESMILSSLDHVAIPTIYDYFYDDKESRFYLVMKYISGGDLSSRLRSAQEGKIDEKSVSEWAIQIIDVLDYLHNQPSTIVYRDLKPSNIMIDGNSGRAMLIDFGIARSINQKEEKGVTAVGTMGYAPPELFSGNVEPRSDIYSLGSTMFHLLTGADPQSNPLLIFDFQKNPRPRQINPQLSDQIERILMRSVEYSADARFKSAAEMREVLEDHLQKLKSGNVTYGVTEIPASVSLANQSVFCGFCGQRIVATDLFCAFCGAKQPIAQQGVHSEIYSEGAWTAKLVIEGTSELSAPAFSLQKDDNLVGRRDPMSNIFPEVDLSKYDPQTKISRRHARIWRDGNNFMVEDLGSSNGTILARSVTDSFRLVPNQPQVLTAGDKIRVGDATLHFVIG